MCAEDVEVRLAAAEAELLSYHHAWGWVENLNRGFPIDGWDVLGEVIVETTMSLEHTHRPVLRRIAMAMVMATTSSILAPDAEIGPLGP